MKFDCNEIIIIYYYIMTMTKKKYCTREVEDGGEEYVYASLRRPPSPSDTYRLRDVL